MGILARCWPIACAADLASDECQPEAPRQIETVTPRAELVALSAATTTSPAMKTAGGWRASWMRSLRFRPALNCGLLLPRRYPAVWAATPISS